MNILLAMVVAFCWGTTYAVAQYSLAGWPPLLLAALRALPAGLLLLMIKPNLPKRNEWSILVRLGVTNIALFFSLLFVMSQTLPSAISAMGMIYVPVFAMLFSWVRYKKSSSKVQIISGIILLILAWGLFDPQHIQLNSIGLLALAGAITCIIVGGNLTKSLTNEIHWWTVVSWQLIVGGSLMALLAIGQAIISPTQYIYALEHFSHLNAAGLLWLIFPNTALAYSLYVWLLNRMTVVEFTFAGISNPIAGVLLGLLLLGETFSFHQYSLMGAMIITSLLPPLFAHYISKKALKRATLQTCYS